VTDPREQKQHHRQFLLGILPEPQAQALEERIFLEPDLAEDLRIEEEELVADYHAGVLAGEERRLFERKYEASETNKRLLHYEVAFREFVVSTSHRQPVEQLSKVDTDRILSVETQPIEPVRSPVAAVSRWWTSLFARRRALAYSTVVFALIIITVAFWYFRYAGDGANNLAQRRAIEGALALLNGPGGTGTALFGEGVELKPIERFSGELVRVGAENVTSSGLIQFRLSLSAGGASQYDATFLDEKRNELFTVSNIAVRSTSSGPQVWVVVPVRYLNRGDYQIELKASNSGSSTSNSYPFRVVS
jgi:anti-sigma-K factor RskA